MKLTKYLLPVALATLMTSCDMCDTEPVLPPVKAPTNTMQANMTILEFKQQYWSTQSSSMTQVGLTADGDSIYLRGRVISSDITGNLYKQLVLRDETAALSFSVNLNDVYRNYPYGAEVVVNVTGLYAGMNSNYFITGSQEAGYGYPRSIAEEAFKLAAGPDGWPDSSAVIATPVDIDFLNTIRSDAAGRQEWQSQLVTVDGVSFETPGQEFAPTSSRTESRYVRDASGNRLILRFSGRSSFAHRIIPTGTGSVTGILSFYNNDWQLIPCNVSDLKGFDAVGGGEDEPGADDGDGSEAMPYSVGQAITKAGTGTAWVKGYIIGCMNSNNNYTLEVTAPFTVASNVYIADKKDEDITSRMLPVQLVAGSEIRAAVNLVDNPDNLGKTLSIQGSLENYFQQPGLKNPTAYKLDGQGGGTVTPPAETATFVRATTIADGSYIIWSDNKIGKAFNDGYNYGYMQSADCVPAADGSISATTADLYTFKQEAKGWTICDAHGQFLYQDTTHESFQLSKTPDTASDYTYWTVTPASDGSFTIVNCGTGNTFRYDASYKTFAGYKDAAKGSAIYLYQPAK